MPMLLLDIEMHRLKTHGLYDCVATKTRPFTPVLAGIDLYVDCRTDEDKEKMFRFIALSYESVPYNYEVLKHFGEYAFTEFTNIKLKNAVDGLLPLMVSLDEFMSEKDLTLRQKKAARISANYDLYNGLISIVHTRALG